MDVRCFEEESSDTIIYYFRAGLETVQDAVVNPEVLVWKVSGLSIAKVERHVLFRSLPSDLCVELLVGHSDGLRSARAFEDTFGEKSKFDEVFIGGRPRGSALCQCSRRERRKLQRNSSSLPWLDLGDAVVDDVQECFADEMGAGFS